MSKVITKHLNREDFNKELKEVLSNPKLALWEIKNKKLDAYVFYSYIDLNGNTVKLICKN